MNERKRAWWQEPKATVAKAASDCFQSIEKARSEVSKDNVRHARLYGSRDIASLGLAAGSNYGQRAVASTDNLVQSVCDTAAALVAKDRPRARFVTDGAEFSEYTRALLLEKFVYGIFQEVDVWEKAVDAFRDATIFGTGCLKIFAANGRVAIERVLIDEIFVDELECMSGEMPRQLFHRKFVSREVLKAIFPDSEEDIDGASDEPRIYPAFRKTNPDLIEVVEAIHRPYRTVDGDDEEEEGDDGVTPHGGRRLIFVPGIDTPLLDEPWTDPEFNYLFYRWTKLPVGFYGQGLAAELAPIQLQLNKLYRFVQRAHDLIAIPRIFLNRLSRINPHHITNGMGEICEYTGQPPVFLTPTAIGPEVYNWIEQLISRGYRRAGIGESTASATKPPGIDSGVGLRELRDQNSGRFIIQGQRFEDLIKGAARWTVKIGKQIHEEDGQFRSVFVGRTVAEKIDWENAELDDGSYVVKVEMSSILGMTPAGRLQSVMDLFHEGFIDRGEARHLLQHPDLEQSDNLADAERQNIDKTIERLLKGEWVSPWPLQNLDKSIVLVMRSALLADAQGAPPEILENCVRWVEQAKVLRDGQQPDPNVLAAQQQQAAAALPPGMPGPVAPGMQPPGPAMPAMAPGMMPPAGVVPPGVMPPPPALQ